MKTLLIACALFIATTAPALACEFNEDGEDAATYTLHCPKAVVKHLKREEYCFHWMGEESGEEDTPARRKEIVDGMTKGKCFTLECDRQALLDKYKKNPKTHAAIEDAISAITSDEEWKNDRDESCAKF